MGGPGDVGDDGGCVGQGDGGVTQLGEPMRSQHLAGIDSAACGIDAPLHAVLDEELQEVGG